MPEKPNPKLHPHPRVRRKRPATATKPRDAEVAEPSTSIDLPSSNPQSAIRNPQLPPLSTPYAELHCKTNFSFLRGAAHPEELVDRAADLGYRALAVTDRNSLAGVVRMHLAAKQRGLKLLIGAEIVPLDAPPVVLLAPTREAYGRLSRLITTGRRRAVKGDCRITLDDLAAHSDGLLALICPLGPISPILRDLFGDRAYLLAELGYGSDDASQLASLQRLSRRTRLPLVAANDVHYHLPRRRYLHDILTCVRHQCTLHTVGRRLLPNARRHLLEPADLARRFAACPAAVERTVALANQCTFSLDELRYEYPEELCPAGTTAMDYLTQLTWAGARERYAGRVPEHVRGLLEHELALIRDLRYEAYFLTVWDLVRFARSRGILCQGRGSAANSVVCYCLGVTAVDPVKIDLLFERFVSRERNEPPDIDVDFEHERREEVFQYIYAKYGRQRAALTAEVITYRPRSAIRDVGKALGLSLELVDALAKRMDWWDHAALPESVIREAGFDPHDRTLRMLVRLVTDLIGFPRHLSQHVGGFVITQKPLCETVPIENAAMPDRTFIEWDKDDLDALGMLKVDCLALGMLTAIRKCFDLIKWPREGEAPAEPSARRQESSGDQGGSPNGKRQEAKPDRARPCRPGECQKPDIHQDAEPSSPSTQHSTLSTSRVPSSLFDIPAEDPAVYAMICAADTVGVFQIESRAQMAMLPRLRPRNFYDLVVEVAIVRPGPIQGGMVHPYLRRRNGEEPVDYPNPAVADVLRKTLGVPLFQEQAMRLAVVAAGFTPGEADQLRRAMGAWRRNGIIEQFHTKLVHGMLANGYPQEFAEQCFRQISGFGEYGFPESHAASFALLVYASAWLKRYYPAAYTAALLNAQPMGFYAPAQLVRDARNHGVEVLAPDVNHSAYDCTLIGPIGPMGPMLRLGFRLIRGLSAAKVRGLEAARAAGPITSLRALARRDDVSRETLVRLAAADAFRSLGLNRREALWEVLALHDEPGLLADLEPDEPPPALPPTVLAERVVQDYNTLGLSLESHPIALLREDLTALGVQPNAVLKEAPRGRRVTVSGLVLVRQRPATANGTVFMTLEDETEIANLIIRATTWKRIRRVARTSVAVIAEGIVERQGPVVHVTVRQMADVSERLAALRSQSRDFH
jgi:error-prone DNA polymerase